MKRIKITVLLVLGVFLVVLAIFLSSRKTDTPIPDFVSSMQISETSFPDRICNITDFGAVTDGQTMNTLAFRKAVESCANQGGGTVLVPDGLWLTGPINLKDNINLHLEKDAEILFSTDFSDYLPVVFSRYEGIEYYNYSPPIYTKDAKNVAITGEGKLNGQAKNSWWDSQKFSADKKNIMLYRMSQRQTPLEERVFGQTEDGFRPAFVEFLNCDRILIDGVTLVDGPMWTIHPLYSQNIIINNVTVETAGGNSTDGVAVDSSRNVLIENCDFNTGDDAIAIKSGRDTDGRRVNRPSENIIVKNNHARSARAVIAIGSEVSGGIKNVFVGNYSADRVKFGIRVKSGIERGGFIENIRIQNMKIAETQDTAIEIDQIYGEGTKLSEKLEINPSRINNIQIADVAVGKAESPLVINGYPALPISDITLENIRIQSQKKASVQNAREIKFNGADISSCKDCL